MNIFSKFQLFSSNGLELCYFEYISTQITEWLNQGMTEVFVEQPQLHRVCYKTWPKTYLSATWVSWCNADTFICYVILYFIYLNKKNSKFYWFTLVEFDKFRWKFWISTLVHFIHCNCRTLQRPFELQYGPSNISLWR